MNNEIEDIYIEICQDLDLFEPLVDGYLEKYPDSSKEEIVSYIVNLIAKEYFKEADDDKLLRQRDITRDRIVSKTLNSLSDSSDIKNKKDPIKKAIARVSNSGTSVSAI